MTVQAISVSEINLNSSIWIRFYSDFGEFLIAISITAQQEPKKKLEWAFTMYGMCHFERYEIQIEIFLNRY